MKQLTNVEAAGLVLNLIPRIDFKGAEIDALLALKVWATTIVYEAERQPTLPGIAAE